MKHNFSHKVFNTTYQRHYSYYLLEATDGITLVSDSPAENNGDSWSVHSFELDKVFITEADRLVHFLNALRICTQENL